MATLNRILTSCLVTHPSPQSQKSEAAMDRGPGFLLYSWCGALSSCCHRPLVYQTGKDMPFTLEFFTDTVVPVVWNVSLYFSCMKTKFFLFNVMNSTKIFLKVKFLCFHITIWIGSDIQKHLKSSKHILTSLPSMQLSPPYIITTINS